jgi:NAD(P)-dependent dehydrogenase (short-subunit alcohol dehydrogenase family)
VTTEAPCALVTGGTGRVGGAVARQLEYEGYRVLAAGRKDGDVSRPDQARALVERCVAEHGRLDVLVNAAANGFAPRDVEELTEDDWDSAFGAVAKGSFFVTQAAAPHMRRSDVGLVVMIEDVASFQPWASFAAHCAAKAAQAMLTRVLAKALAPDIRVCGIAPGTVATAAELEEKRAGETVLGRIGTPQDVADAVVYLLDARFVTGSTIFVDGGRLIASPRR